MELCAENRVYVGNIRLRLHLRKYTRVTRGQDLEEVKGIIDLVLGKKEMLRYEQDVKEVRGMRRGLSDHHVVLCKVSLVGA